MSTATIHTMWPKAGDEVRDAQVFHHFPPASAASPTVHMSNLGGSERYYTAKGAADLELA